MKRLAFSIIILCTVIVSAVSSSVMLLEKTDRLESEINECIVFCKSGNETEALKKASDISSFSEKNSAVFNIFYNHNDVNELFTLMPMLPVYAENGTDELYVYARQCLVLLRNVRHGILPFHDMIL